jgi:hypothetical protein
MKGRFIAGVLVFALGLAGCGTPESAEITTTSVTTTAAAIEIPKTSEDTTTATSTTALKTTTTPTTTTPPTETVAETTEKPWELNFAEETFEYIKAKNIEEIEYRMGYCEGENGWLYNVTFENFEIVEELRYNDDTYGYIIKITVSESSDPRFPVGESLRNFEFYNWVSGVDNFTPIDDNGDYRQQLQGISDITSSDKALTLVYAFEHSFGYFGDIPDMSDCSTYFKPEYFSVSAFEYTPIILGEYSGTILDQEYVDKWYYQLLGVKEQPYNVYDYISSDYLKQFGNLYAGERWKPWDNAGYGWRLDEQTDNTITITFFGDRCYLTPAKTIKYTYEVNDGIPRLLSSELIEDFGYEPYMMDFY